MMSLESIRDASRQAAKKAADENLTPYIVREGDIDDWKNGVGLPLPFPNIGDYDPPGFTKLRDLFVDSSGLGQPGERALTQAEFFDELVVDRAYAITEVGQFQLYVTEYDAAGRYEVREDSAEYEVDNDLAARALDEILARLREAGEVAETVKARYPEIDAAIHRLGIGVSLRRKKVGFESGSPLDKLDETAAKHWLNDVDLDDEVKETPPRYDVGTNITPELRRAFNALRDPDYDNLALLSCFVNDEPAAAIVAVNVDVEADEYTIYPIFVSVTPGMRLVDHEGDEPTYETVNEDSPRYVPARDLAGFTDDEVLGIWVGRYYPWQVKSILAKESNRTLDDVVTSLVSEARESGLPGTVPPAVESLAGAMRESGVEVEVMQRVDDQVDEDNRRRRAETGKTWYDELVDAGLSTDWAELEREADAAIDYLRRTMPADDSEAYAALDTITRKLRRLLAVVGGITPAADCLGDIETKYGPPRSACSVCGQELIENDDHPYGYCPNDEAHKVRAGGGYCEICGTRLLFDEYELAWVCPDGDRLVVADEVAYCYVCGHELNVDDDHPAGYCPNDPDVNDGPGEVNETPPRYDPDENPGLGLMRELRRELIAAGDWDTKRQGIYDRIVAKLYPDSGLDEVESVYVGVCAECDRYYDDNDPGLNLCKTCSDWTVDGVAEPTPKYHADANAWSIPENLKPKKLYERVGSAFRPAPREVVRDVAIASYQVEVGQAIKSPADTEAWLRLHFAGREYEVFGLLILDNRHRVLTWLDLFRGTIDGTAVYTREVVKEVLDRNGAAVILAHNHPSGVAEPSQADERITKRIKVALETVDVRLLDHLIVGTDKVTSLAERGVI